MILEGANSINKLISEIKYKKGILFAITQLVILFLCIFKLIFRVTYFELSNFIMISISALLGIISLFLWIRAPICQGDENCENIQRLKYSSTRDLKCLLREQRHDYMNVFQIIYGYLQLNKSDKAIEQIKKLTNTTASISNLNSLSIFSVSLLLEKKIKEAENQEVEIICNVNTYITSEFRTVQNERQIVVELTGIIDFLLEKIYKNYCESKLFINISEYNDRLEFVFKGDIDIALKSDILKMHEDASITNGEFKLIFDCKEVKIIKPEDIIYFSLLNNI